MSTGDETFDLELAEALGATAPTSIQVLSLYIPNKDRDGNPVEDQERWVEQAAELLAQMGGGVTVLPPCRGGWQNPESNVIVWEEPIIVFTYIKPEQFLELLPTLRAFLHRLGRETRQGEVALEFDGSFYRIVEFDRHDSGGGL